MKVWSFLPLLAAPDGTAGGGTGSLITSFIPFILIIAIFYLLIIRPQNKKQKETQRMLNAIKKGDRVVTAGGVHGTIDKVKENTVILKVDDYTKMEFSRSSISSIEASAKEDKTEKLEDKSDGKDEATAKEEKSEAKEVKEEKKSGVTK